MSSEKVKFQILLQDRLLKIIDDAAAESLMTTTRYIPMVLQGYQTGRHALVRPDPAAPLSKGRQGQVFKTSRLSALYPSETVSWLDDLGCRAGGFNRSHTCILLLLDWLRINPFEKVFQLKAPTLETPKSNVSAATTSLTNRIKTTFTCQSHVLDILRKVAPPLSLQGYIRLVLACYAWGEERAYRPPPDAIPALPGLSENPDHPSETLDFYFGPELVDWLDDLAARAGGFNRSHTMLLVLLEWLRINAFTKTGGIQLGLRLFDNR